MKFTSSSILIYLTSLPTDHSTAFAPPSSLHRIQPKHTTNTILSLNVDNNNNRVPSDDDRKERKRDKVRSLLTQTANRAASAIHRNAIANAIRDTAVEGGGLASEKLIRVLNRIEGTLDAVEAEVNCLRDELRGVRDVVTVRIVDDAVKDSAEVEVIDIADHDVSAVFQSQPVNVSQEDTTTLATAEMDIETTTSSSTSQTTTSTTTDLSALKYRDIDYTSTEMTPPFIGEDECLVPGEPVVRVEKAPQNSRRIFAGIDIPVSVEDVWGVSKVFVSLCLCFRCVVLDTY